MSADEPSLKIFTSNGGTIKDDKVSWTKEELQNSLTKQASVYWESKNFTGELIIPFK
uniref:hypothetical protein n=1 Tax=Lactococcus garvieae TaxID=1363 RepID=UPI00359C9BC5